MMGPVSGSRMVAVAAVVAITATLVGCAGISAPAAPTAAQLPVLVSRAEGAGSTGYADYDVTLVRFISDQEWPTVMTQCVRTQGITHVDFRLLPPGPYSYPSDPQGGAALARALNACSLEYPSEAMRTTLRTTAQWSYQYSYLVDDFVACVRAAGGRVSKLPTRGRYISIAESSLVLPSPYGYVSRVPAGVPRTLLESRCPATAPGL